jgi:hypothetical protein
VKTLATKTGHGWKRKTWRRRGENPSDDGATSTGDDRIAKTWRRRGQIPSEDAATSTGDNRIRKPWMRRGLPYGRCGEVKTLGGCSGGRAHTQREWRNVPAERMPRKGRWDCGRGRRTDATEDLAAIEGESLQRTQVDENRREYPASSGRVGRAASDSLCKAGFRRKRDRQKLSQKLGVWPRLQLLAARICPESQTNRHIIVGQITLLHKVWSEKEHEKMKRER